MPDILNTSVYDEIITVTNEDAFATGKMIGRTEGVLVGISSGAAVFAAMQLAKREENKGKTIVVLLPDTGDRYLTTRCSPINRGNRRKYERKIKMTIYADNAATTKMCREAIEAMLPYMDKIYGNPSSCIPSGLRLPTLLRGRGRP